MVVLLKYHWLLASLAASSSIPYWIGKFLVVAPKQQAQEVKSSDTTGTSSTTSSCTAGASMAPSNVSRTFPCCTVQLLLLSVWQRDTSNNDKVLTNLEGLEDTSVELSKKLGLDIDLDSFQCSSSEGQKKNSKDEKTHLLRCLGPLRGRGYFSVTQWIETKKSGDDDDGSDADDLIIVTKSKPMQIDFYLPPGASRNVQDVIDKVAFHFTSSSSSSTTRTTTTTTTTPPPQPPHVVWFQAERGFRYLPGANPTDDLSLDNPWVVDMSNTLLKPNKIYKKHVAHIETAFQHIDIYDTIDTHYDKFTFAPPGDGDDDDAVLAISPDREVYFDSIMQSRKRGMEAYHEALVHPLMLAHKNPARVAIFGGGEGGTLREVLKHNTVVECVMIEIDEEIAQASKDVLRDWNDCSDLITGTGEPPVPGQYVSCYDDPRATLYFQDAIAWFIERFFKKQNVHESEKFDVIILDSLDPGSMLAFSDYMYGNLDFAKALRGALREGGILGGQVGIDKQSDLDEDHDWIRMVANLQKTGFYALNDYMEGSCGFDDAWKFFVAPTDAHGLARWFSSEAQFDMEIARRAVHTRSGQSPFKYIDGGTMALYQAPSRVTENLYCEFVGEQNDECKWGLGNMRENFENKEEEDTTASAMTMSTCNDVHSTLIMPSTLQLMRSGTMAAAEINVGVTVPHYGEDALLVIQGAFNDDEILPQGRDIFYNPSLHRHHWAAQNCQTASSNNSRS